MRRRHRLYAAEASTLCGGGIDSMRRRHRLYAAEASTLCGGGIESMRRRGIDRLRWIGMNYR
jgi:hypothetical protein